MRNFTRVAVLAIATFATSAQAQDWTSSTRANGSLLFGYAGDPGGTFGVGCTAPAPENVPLIETGSHESHRTEPFEVYLSFADRLFQWSSPYHIEGASLTVGSTTYALPRIDLNELSGTAVYLPMDDPLIEALYGATSLVLDTGQGIGYEYPVEGISPALTNALGHCVYRFAELGHTIPETLSRYWLEGEETVEPATATSPMRAAAIASVEATCGGPASIAEYALLTQDIDGDGIDDVLLDWGGVSCVTPTPMTAGHGAGQCGMENCLIEFFVSGTHTPGALPPGMLAMGVENIPGVPTDFRFGGASGVCRQLGLELGCSTLHRWQDGAFQRIVE